MYQKHPDVVNASVPGPVKDTAEMSVWRQFFQLVSLVLGSKAYSEWDSCPYKRRQRFLLLCKETKKSLPSGSGPWSYTKTLWSQTSGPQSCEKQISIVSKLPGIRYFITAQTDLVTWQTLKSRWGDIYHSTCDYLPEEAMTPMPWCYMQLQG